MVLVKIGEKDDRILLESDAGDRGWFRFLDMVTYRGKEYAALLDEADEPIIMEFTEAAGTAKERYMEITDDAVFYAVAAMLEETDD